MSQVNSRSLKSKFFTSIVIVGLSAISAQSCSTSRVSGWEKSVVGGGLSTADLKKKKDKALAHWNNRGTKSELEASLKSFEEVAAASPNDLESLNYLCRGNYFLADGHLTEPAAKKSVWEAGTAWCERALATNAVFRKKVKEEGKKIEEALDALTVNEVPALYWGASNLGKWSRLSGISELLANKNRIRLMIERVEALQPDYFYGAVPRYWGVYYAVAPSFAGGSLPKSEENFQRSLKMTNDYFGTHVLIADTLAPKKDDRALFKKHLEFVINGKSAVLPDIVPEQDAEKRKAKKMLESMEDYF
jgi:hypothetical protein